VSIVAALGASNQAVTSTDTDGTYSLVLAPGQTYHVSVNFAGFAGIARDLTASAPPCDQTIDLRMALQPRDPASVSRGEPGAPGARVPAERAATGQQPNVDATATAGNQPARTGRGGRGGGAGGAGGAGGGQNNSANGRRFQTLTVQSDSNGDAAPDAVPTQEGVGALLPPGFSLQSAQGDAVAITGANNATSLDRGLMNGRSQMINLGQLDPISGQFAQGFGPPGLGVPGAGANGGLPGAAGFGQGLGGFGPGGRQGGPGGRGGFFLGGRNARNQNPYQGSATYTFGGSVLDSPPYQLRPDVPVTQPAFTRNGFGGTFGGPFKIPGLYSDENRRTNFQVNYTGSRSSTVFDQYATVPTDAERTGDFSGLPIQLIDPTTGQKFVGNQIPKASLNASAASLLPFIPAPNLPGTTQNYHVSTLAPTSSEAISFRMRQNLSRTVPQANGPGGRGGFGGGGFGGGGFGGGGRGGGLGPNGGTGTNIVLNAQVQYRRTATDTLNVFPNLGSNTVSQSLTAPFSLNIRRGRSIQNFTVTMTHATTNTTNAFANSDNAAGLAGIQYPGTAATDPLNWGVPNLSITGLTGVQSPAASLRTDNRLTAGYAWIHPSGAHRLRIGGDFRLDRSDAEINANARGTFTFTGFYTSGGASVLGPTAADYSFADFLLGLPQQASLQVGGTSHLRQRSFDGYVEDNWQKSAKLTLNLGLRYELALPYTELNGRMANLDVTQNFSAATPVLPDGIGPYTGGFPAGLLNADTNNLGPRLGFAYRLQPNTILRGGYSIIYNSGAYASIARQLVGQPPFADVETVADDDSEAPLTLAQALLSTPSSTTTNNWGVDRDYALGMLQTWNLTVTKNLTQNWFVQAGYTGIKGSDLDILRAPELGAGGTLIAGTQPFIWESSGGRSIMNGGVFQVQRRLADGYSGGFTYTLAKAMDNTASLGTGTPVVVQNDNNLAAEWARSNFDRRQQFSGNLYVELPWGPNRHWLNNGGLLAGILGEWSAQFTLTLQTGTPLTARVLSVANDLLRGVNGSIRANYNGAPIQLTDPTVDAFFNTAAFSVPAPGTFGDAARNMIAGPGARQLNALFQRDVRIGGTRSITLQVNANNLLNAIQWAAVDTNINSPTFGQVLSAKPMRTVTLTARLRF
jgi:hypothetical protein